VYRTIAFAFVAHQEKKRRAQARYDQNEGSGNDNFHVGGRRALRLAFS
jgi:hypothetical protein